MMLRTVTETTGGHVHPSESTSIGSHDQLGRVIGATRTFHGNCVAACWRSSRLNLVDDNPRPHDRGSCRFGGQRSSRNGQGGWQKYETCSAYRQGLTSASNRRARDVRAADDVRS